MTKRKLGNSGLEIAPLALGGNVFGWTADEATSFRLLDTFVDNGFNFVDTADVYSKWALGNQGGESETVIGKWLKQSGKRGKVIIATKVGMELSLLDKGLSKKYILRAVDKSLQRLQTDYIDLYQSHKDDPETDLEETLDAFRQLIREGKVRAIGASNYSRERLSEALHVSERLGYPKYESLQPLYNLYDRADYEQNLEPLCQQMGVGVITYYSLATGFLTGKYRSEQEASSRPRFYNLKKCFNERGFRILDALDKVARELASTPTKVALAWLMARPSVTAPIASATSLEQLQDLMQSSELQLDSAAIATLNQASA